MMTMQTAERPTTLQLTLADLGLPARTGHEDDVHRVLDTPVERDLFEFLSGRAAGIDVSDELLRVVDYFKTPEGSTPAGFRRDLKLHGSTLVVDLVRDIGCGENGRERPTKVLYSADSPTPTR